MRTAAAVALLACVVGAQEKAPLALDAVLVTPKELPKNIKLLDGIHCVSPQARTYFETPAMKDIMKKLAPEMAARISEQTLDQFPVPKRKEIQSFQADGRATGSVLVYEYANAGDATCSLVFLREYIWGGSRSEQHPEEIFLQDRFIWVLSFPYPLGDPAAEWYKERLRKKLRIRAPRERADLTPLRQQAVKAYEAKDADNGIRLLQDAKAANWSFGQNLLGQFAQMKGDQALAEKAFRKALQLHDSLADPLDPRLLWVTLDGLAIALHAQGKRPEALKALDRALEAAKECDEGEGNARGQSTYNQACVYAMMKKYEDAWHSLAAAIAIDPSYVDAARKDADFAEALKQKDFEDMLAQAEKKAKSKGPLSLDLVLVKQEELPKNVQAIEGIHTNQPHPRIFYETPTIEGFAKGLPPELRALHREDSLPVPKRKQHQSFVAEGGAKGTVFVFEYETDDLRKVVHFLEPILWGREGPSEEHPEEIVVHGRLLWILSFPRGDAAAEWYKERLRKKFKVRASRDRPELHPLGIQVLERLETGDIDGGLRLLNENAKAIEDWAFGQCMLGQLATIKKDLALAERGFRRALALHDDVTDPLDPDFLWVVVDGLGRVLDEQGKLEPAARMFERGIDVANERGDVENATTSCYNIARTLARMKNFETAYRALKQVISVDKQYKERAKAEPAFAEARTRKEFQELLK